MENFQKAIHLLLNLYEHERKNYLFELIKASRFIPKKHWNTTLSPEWKAITLDIFTRHDVYVKNYSNIKNIEKIIQIDLNNITPLAVGEVTILPDYDSFEIVESTIKPVLTDWEEINKDQNELFKQLSSSSDSLALQHVGTIARTIMQKLAGIVYVHEKHKPEDEKILVTPDKFKNRLHSYIKKELAGDTNKELRHLAESSIDYVENLIDLANTVTHKIGVERPFAEICVTGTIAAINIIKVVHSMSSNNK